MLSTCKRLATPMNAAANTATTQTTAAAIFRERTIASGVFPIPLVYHQAIRRRAVCIKGFIYYGEEYAGRAFPCRRSSAARLV